MSKGEAVTNLEQLLDRIDEAAQNQDNVSFDDVLDVVGRRSFGPLLLLAGLITSLPIIGDIPGVPVMMGMFILLIAGQLLFHREHLWMPNWLLKRSVQRDKLLKSLAWMRSPARWLDRLLRPRLTAFTNRTAMYVIAVVCIAIAAATPLMEVVPFSANIAGAALMAFALSLIAHDGLLALLAFVFTAITSGLLLYNLL